MKDYNVAYGKTSTILCGGGGGGAITVGDSKTKDMKIAKLEQQIEDMKKENEALRKLLIDADYRAWKKERTKEK